MTWEDLVALQKKVEVDKPEPLQLKAWADGWLWAIKELRGTDFYELGKGALVSNPFTDAPHYFNEGIHKMLGSQARQAWVYVAFHTGIPNVDMEAAWGDLRDTDWRHNPTAQLEFFSLIKEPEKFVPFYYKNVEGTESQKYIRQLIKAQAARVLSRDSEMDEKSRVAWEENATSAAPRIPGTNHKAGAYFRHWKYRPLFNDGTTTQGPQQPNIPAAQRPDVKPRPRREPTPVIDPAMGPQEPSSAPSRPQLRQRNEQGHSALNFDPKRPRREPRPTEYEESPSYGVILGAIIIVGIAVYSQM